MSHGAPLGADEIKLTKEAYKWTFEEDFHVPQEVYDHFRSFNQLKEEYKKKKNGMNYFQITKNEFPELALAT